MVCSVLFLFLILRSFYTNNCYPAVDLANLTITCPYCNVPFSCSSCLLIVLSCLTRTLWLQSPLDSLTGLFILAILNLVIFLPCRHVPVFYLLVLSCLSSCSSCSHAQFRPYLSPSITIFLSSCFYLGSSQLFCTCYNSCLFSLICSAPKCPDLCVLYFLFKLFFLVCISSQYCTVLS